MTWAASDVLALLGGAGTLGLAIAALVFQGRYAGERDVRKDLQRDVRDLDAAKNTLTTERNDAQAEVARLTESLRSAHEQLDALRSDPDVRRDLRGGVPDLSETDAGGADTSGLRTKPPIAADLP